MSPKISTTIKKIYFTEKMNDLLTNGFFNEYKDIKPFWTTRINNLLNKDPNLQNSQITFLIGQKSFKFNVKTIFKVPLTSIPEKYKSAMTGPKVFQIKCIPIKKTKTK